MCFNNYLLNSFTKVIAKQCEAPIFTRVNHIPHGRKTARLFPVSRSQISPGKEPAVSFNYCINVRNRRDCCTVHKDI